MTAVIMTTEPPRRRRAKAQQDIETAVQRDVDDAGGEQDAATAAR
jgi:hypothetical protein